MPELQLDVLLPTYQRPELLLRTLASLAAAPRPEGLAVQVWVVDNNSRDSTPDVVAEQQKQFPIPLHYIVETVQGLSPAMNAGIRASSGDLIGLINDDEEIDVHWYEVIHRIFTSTGYSFLGGPYIPRWGGERPEWVVPEFGSVVGWVEAGDKPREYGDGFHGILMSGNAIVRRPVYEKAGLYNVALGRTNKGLLSCEDEDMFGRVLAAGFRGLYSPELIIHHYVPPERLTRRYHRKWCWGQGISKGVLARTRSSGVVEVLGIPRWQIRQGLGGLVRAAKGKVGWAPAAESFEGELRVWSLAGYIHGRYFWKR
ncbi:MAG TPA: glycosyltransferase [Bryobacteraceae bacterium]|nr:glycosyltransferase [Bryobacteraceae bacterium]